VASTDRALDRANRRASRTVRQIGEELRAARRDRDLSQGSIARAVAISASEVSRIERGLVAGVSVARLTQLAETVGLDLTVRAFPGGQPLRDAGQLRVLGRLRAATSPALRWSMEVPFATPGDQRAWDAVVSGPGWRYGVEVETGPTDGQALARRLRLKLRDGGVDALLLVVPSTRRVRAFLEAATELLAPVFPVPGRIALQRLAAGADPDGSAIVVI
jgi:transcriptional regulator with XRE-family HTH domain